MTGGAGGAAEALVATGAPVALVVVPGTGVALASRDGARTLPGDPVRLVRELESVGPRWVWWSARVTAAPLVEAGIRPRACWDLGAVSRLLHGTGRDDEASVWALHRGLDEPPEARGELSLLDLAGEDDAAVRPDGHLSREWLRGEWARDLDHALTWARLALEVFTQQQRDVAALPDPRALPGPSSLPSLVALSESMAALLAVELGHDGLPLDRDLLESMLEATVGARPLSEADEDRARRARDTPVWDAFGGDVVDLRNPAAVRDLLARHGIDVPDTRSWRLEAYAATSPGVAALLHWRKVERIATTYGWGWLDRHVGDDDRLRGTWTASEGAGRMTASAGLHNLPAELRPAVRPRPGRVLVRSDLGQIEPRVLAAVSGDQRLADAARDDDMYAPVARALGSDRPTAKVAVLAAMYGQTTGPAGEALKDMERTYPRALAYLRDAEDKGRRGVDLRTYGGRLIRLSTLLEDAGGEGAPSAHGYGRFARNAVVQGAAAELFKAWAATVRARLAGGDARIVLCLHDELLVECDEAHATAVASAVDEALQSTAAWWCSGSHVRLVSDTSVAPSWADAKDPARTDDAASVRNGSASTPG